VDCPRGHYIGTYGLAVYAPVSLAILPHIRAKQGSPVLRRVEVRPLSFAQKVEVLPATFPARGNNKRLLASLTANHAFVYKEVDDILVSRGMVNVNDANAVSVRVRALQD
jgi:hypothetical protein